MISLTFDIKTKEEGDTSYTSVVPSSSSVLVKYNELEIANKIMDCVSYLLKSLSKENEKDVDKKCNTKKFQNYRK